MRVFASSCLAVSLIIAAPSTPVLAQKKPEKIKLTARSKEGAVLIRVPVDRFGYALQFSKGGNSGFMSRVYLMKVHEADESGYRYIARTLSPGRYRLDSVWQQGHWSACLEQGTFEFDIVPGQIAFLGTVRTDRVLRAIQQQALAAGQAVQSGTAYFQSHDQTAGPPIEGREEAGLEAARDFAHAEMNGSGSLVRLANVSETSFATSAVGKAIKICG